MATMVAKPRILSGSKTNQTQGIHVEWTVILVIVDGYTLSSQRGGGGQGKNESYHTCTFSSL